MATTVVKIQDFPRVFKDLGRRRPEEYQAAAFKGIAKSLPEIIANSPVDTGQYASSWDLDITEEKALLGNFAPHAAIIEFGARPFTPPLGPLLAWAKRVLGDPSQPPNYSNRVWALAVHTQQKIEEKGMEPKHVLRDAIPGIIANIRKELTR